jgi:hypothetical protein
MEDLSMTAQPSCLGGLLALGLVAGSAAAPATAGETTLEATYAATVAGFPVGSGTLSFGVAPTGDYHAAIEAQIRGLATLIANRSASASASGRVSGRDISSRDYSLAIEGGPQANRVEMSFNGGAVARLSANELYFPGWDRRVPLQPEHKRNVVDPLAAFVLAVPPGRDPMAKENCERTARIFDGRVRYDLRMVYGTRMEVQATDVTAPKGADRGNAYVGPALVCAVNYRPIAGFRPLSPEEEKFERNLEFSIWFVPVAGASVLLPYKIVVGTPIGLLQVYAYRFEARVSGAAEADGPAPRTTASIPAR